MKNWEANIRRVVPYTPGDQPKEKKLIKLNTNENPYPPAPGVERALRDMDVDAFRKYPDPTTSVLVEELSKFYKVKPEQIFVGVGSDDVIGMAFLTCFNSEKPILFPDVTYSFYPVWAELFQIPYKTPALDENFQIKKEDYFCENGGVIFPNPNAPTGMELELSDIEEIIRQNQDVVVIIDEAYIDFGGQSALPLIDKYDNLLVVQTFSKSRSMAGMRIGFAFGQEKLIKAMQDVKYSYNSYTMNLPSQILGAEAVKDQEYFEKTVAKVVETREETKVWLKELGFHFPDSKSNFIFASHKSVPAKEIFEALKEQKIFVRYFDKPRLNNSLRISIGTPDEMLELKKFLTAYLQGR